MNKDTFCIYPFTSLALKHFNNKGALESFWPCCMMGDPVDGQWEPNRLGIEGVNDMSPEEMFNHPRMKLLRDNLANGVKDSACAVCWKKEEHGITSFRQISLSDTSTTTPEFIERVIENPTVEEIDISITNLCNLRCRMCAPSLSNSLVIDDDYFKKNGMLDEVIKVTGWWNNISYSYKIDESVTWDWLLNNTQQLKTVKMSGGEPFYNKHVIRFIDKCIEDDTAKNLTLAFRTNGTKFSKDIMEKLIKFKNNFHDISVDGFEKSHEYIRFPSTFESLDKSIRLYKSYISVPMRLVYIVSIHNIMDIPKFIDWARSIDGNSNLMFSQIYSNERGIALKHLSVKLLNKAKEQLLPYATMPGSHNINDVIAQIDDAIKFNKEDRSLALRETVLFDKSRNQSFEDYLNADIVDWLKNVQE